MKDFKSFALQKLNVDKQLLLLYCVIYFLWGLGMNWFGAQVEIAKFTFWWQVITCYILYMVPISLLLRGLPFHAQYAYGLVAMGILEFSGYALQTSYAFPNNILDELFNIRNFSLGMALFFALYFPLGNWGVNKIYSFIFDKK
ncbi:hypothetical protein HME9304_03187 [Flagellimonas maritima]|uniref:Uncharacterized protein n=1 Tax=Flagellimonas maritima TaxID=1383885 RepID=A0A2Z4LW18_9FLAO|nr:hypothetical protein [Allomuricauda aurantiaca]AWX46155.1 hypothetical protein HME9304_03187 [Allomuricauda aurantiaca]